MKKLLSVFLLALCVSFFSSKLYAVNPASSQEVQSNSSNGEVRSYYIGKLSSSATFTISLPSGQIYVGCSANLNYLGGLQFKVKGPLDSGSRQLIGNIATRTSSGSSVFYDIYADVD